MKKNIFVLLILTLLYSSSVYAYLDAGTGGMFIQLLLGGLAVVGTFIKIYWIKIKSFTQTYWSKIKIYTTKSNSKSASPLKEKQE